MNYRIELQESFLGIHISKCYLVSDKKSISAASKNQMHSSICIKIESSICAVHSSHVNLPLSASQLSHSNSDQ